MLVAVGEEDDRAAAVLFLEAVGVELGLLLAGLRIFLRALGLDDGEGSAVVAPEDVVHKAFALVRGHADDAVFAVALLVERPAGLGEHEVDEVIAGFGFRVVVRVGFGGVGALDGGDLFADAAKFFIERRLIGEQCGEFFVPLPQLVLQLLQFFQRLPVSGRRGACAAFGVEGEPRCRFFAASVGVRQPVSDVEEFAGRG